MVVLISSTPHGDVPDARAQRGHPGVHALDGVTETGHGAAQLPDAEIGGQVADAFTDRLDSALHRVDPAADRVEPFDHDGFEPFGALGERGEGLVDPGEPPGGGLHAALELAEPLRDVRHPLGEALGPAADLVHVVAEQFHVLRQPLRPRGRPDRHVVKSLGDRLKRDAETAQLTLAHLAQEPLHAFQPLADLVEHGALRPLLVDVVLGRPGEQLTHPVGDGGLAARLEEVVAGMLHRECSFTRRNVGSARLAQMNEQAARPTANFRP